MNHLSINSILTLAFRRNILSAALFSLVLIFLTACGGGGGGSAGTGGDGGGQAKEVSGVAQVTSDQLAQYKNQDLMYAMGEFFFPVAAAGITGLEPVPGAKVELIKVDDSGKQVGEVLAETVTSITGTYRLALPAGLDFAANLVVRITGKDRELRAQVVEKAVDITPLSEFILQKFIDKGAKLSEIPVNAVIVLSGKAEEFDLAATSDMSSMLEKLEAELGDTVDTAIAAAAAEPGLASSVAGGVHFTDRGMGFQYFNDPLAYSNAAQTADGSAGNAILVDEGDNKLGLKFGSDNFSYTQNSTPNNIDYYIWYELDSSTDDGSYSNIGQVDADGNIFFNFPFEEYLWAPDNNHGARELPSPEQAYNSGVDGIYFSTFIDRSVIFRTNEAKTAIDPNEKVGHDAQFEMSVFAKQASGFNISTLDGNYGAVFMGHQFTHGSGKYGLSVGIQSINISAGKTSIAGLEGGTVVFTPQGDGTATIITPPPVSPAAGTLTAESNGALTYKDDSGNSITGFASTSGELFTTVSTGAEKIFMEGGGEIIKSSTLSNLIAVRKPANTPDLANRTYRLIGLEKIMNTSGQIEINRFRGDDDTISFNTDASKVTVSINGVDRMSQVSNKGDFSVTTVAETYSTTTPVFVGTDGNIAFAQNNEGYLHYWAGFISESGNIIILTALQGTTDEGNSQKGAGQYIAIPVN
ncbi:MAG: hypothetical protein OEY52_09150 [Gammaproteobacteria bacterium]|nr:hypothetical protein [Gammaproteobacteria bacterium]